MKVTVDVVSYPMKVPFAITGHVFHDTDTIRVTLEHDGFVGRGESVGSYYLDETAASMKADLDTVIAKINASTTPESLQDLMPLCGARNALDCALWDLRAKKLRYVTVEAEHCCTTHYKYMTRPEGLRQMRKFDAFVDHTNDNKPPGVVDCFQFWSVT